MEQLFSQDGDAMLHVLVILRQLTEQMGPQTSTTLILRP